MLVRHYRDPSWWPAYKGAMWHQLGAMHVFSLQNSSRTLTTSNRC